MYVCVCVSVCVCVCVWVCVCVCVCYVALRLIQFWAIIDSFLFSFFLSFAHLLYLLLSFSWVFTLCMYPYFSVIFSVLLQFLLFRSMLGPKWSLQFTWPFSSRLKENSATRIFPQRIIITTDGQLVAVVAVRVWILCREAVDVFYNFKQQGGINYQGKGKC